MAGKKFGAWPITAPNDPSFSDTAKVNGVVKPQRKPGSVQTDVNGGRWMYVLSTATVQLGHTLQINSFGSTGIAEKAVLGTTAPDGRMPLGVCGGVITADDYGWIQIFGNNTHLGVLTDTAGITNRVLFLTARAGVLASDTVVPDLVYGMYVSAAASTAVNAASQVADTAMVKKVDADLIYPYALSATAVQ